MATRSRPRHQDQILERHFAPVLDTPSYVAQAGHRFSPDQRAEVHARAQPGLAAPFVSAAFPYAIYLWAPGAVWARAVAVAGLAVAAGYAYGRRAAIRA